MIYPRISARLGQPVDLDVSFYHGGVLTDPYAIYKVEIYKTAVLPHNIVATIPVVESTDPNYPAPVQQLFYESTEPTSDPVAAPGRYQLIYTIPPEFLAPDVYFDLWYYYPVDPLMHGTEPTTETLSDPLIQGQLLKFCSRFWVYPDEWFGDDGLQTVNFGFEPLNQKFYTPEVKPLEVGIMPLPLYDYNANLVDPLIPFLQATISIETTNCELLVDNHPMAIGLRQGSYRSNPYVLKYQLDTGQFLKGTYKYRVLLRFPDGTTRSSRPFVFTIG